MSVSSPKTPTNAGEVLRSAGVATMTVGSFLRERVFPAKGGIRRVAKHTGLDIETLQGLADGGQRVDEHVAEGLAKLFPDTSPVFWINLQANSDPN